MDLNLAIKEAVRQAVREELAELRRSLETLSVTLKEAPEAPRLMTPEEVVRSQRCRTKAVYTALQNGDLPAMRRPARGGKMGYLIKPEDAAAWGRQFSRQQLEAVG